MNRKYFPAIGLVCAVPLLIGASSNSSESDSQYTRLSASGVGYSTQIAETMTISAGVRNFSTSASQAVSDNAVKMDRLRSRLAGLGVKQDDFRTAEFNFSQARNPEGNNDERGFMVSHRLSIVLRQPGQAGSVLDALVAAGATDVTVQKGWGFNSDIDPKSLAQARGQDIKDAQAKADQYARELGMRVRRIVSVADNSSYVSDAPVVRYGFAAIDAGTKIDQRPSTVLANVSMVFELEK
ncbi:MAG: SIMPL domain-containing protein [Proteobacteria bacterium]|nr:SIMPL domain-containing protein [Pseudomonadota bacterium]